VLTFRTGNDVMVSAKGCSTWAPVCFTGDMLQVLHHHKEDLICANLSWIGYVSTTSVYGDWGGGQVDEECVFQSSL
jgi:hypothetical protein